MNHIARSGGALALLMLARPPAAAAAGQTVVRGVRLAHNGDHTRLVFDLSGPIDHKLFTLDNPDRVVIDLKRARLDAPLDEARLSSDLLRRVRSGRRNRDDLRVVLDLRGDITPKSFVLARHGGSPDRLVIDLRRQGQYSAPVTKSRPASDLRDLVVAIDPGHGGRDPGAVGKGGTLEKDVALAIGLKLRTLLSREPGIKPVMTRSSDRRLKLRERVQVARRAKADLFVSIHADALDDRRVHGASVYALSLSGASSEMARQLAQKENAVDLIGGVSLRDKDPQLASVLLDLSQTATIQSSLEIGEEVLGELGKLGRLNRKDVQQAGFAVLKAPDVPSLLIETAFISNPSEERKLRNARHQQKIAGAIAAGVSSYFRRNAPPGTYFSAGRYVIKPGDTLSEIARDHRISVSSLRSANGMSGDRLEAGRLLIIPTG